MDRRDLVTDSHYFLESTICKSNNITSPQQGRKHSNQHLSIRTMMRNIYTRMKTVANRTTITNRACTYPLTLNSLIRTWNHIPFANNQMGIFTERSMQTMDQHIKCNNIIIIGKLYKLETTTLPCIIVIFLRLQGILNVL